MRLALGAVSIVAVSLALATYAAGLTVLQVYVLFEALS